MLNEKDIRVEMTCGANNWIIETPMTEYDALHAILIEACNPWDEYEYDQGRKVI